MAAASRQRGDLYVTTTNGVHALDAATGSELWVFPLLIGSAAPVVANGIVYVGTNFIYALDAATGAKLWSFDTVWGDSTPIASNGIVYARRTSDLVALDATTGAILWTVPELTPFMVYKNTLFAYSDTFTALDATTGAIRWSDPMGAGSWPVAMPGRVYGARNGALTALNSRDREGCLERPGVGPEQHPRKRRPIRG